MFYPLFIDLRHRAVLVVGGGVIAERKIEPLVEAEARVTVVAPDITPGIAKLSDSGAIRIIRRKFVDGDVEGAHLVISATDEPETQERVAASARARNILINTVDQPRLCDFIVPALVRRGDVVVAISTSGKSPSLAAALRGRIETVVTPDAGRAAHILGVIRSEVHDRLPDPDARRRAFEKIVESGILDWIADYDDASALDKVRQMIKGTE